MPSDEQREPSGVRRPSAGDATSGGESEAAKLAADAPEDVDTPLPDDMTRPSEDATRDIEKRQQPRGEGDEGRRPEDGTAY